MPSGTCQRPRGAQSDHHGHGGLAALSRGPGPDAATRKEEAPLGVDKIRVGPNGKLTLEDTKNTVNALSPDACDGDRAYLASIDNEQFLRDIIDDANRGNSTFYMIDPGGLKVERRGPQRRPADARGEHRRPRDAEHQRSRQGIEPDRRRHASYYLLGYYATNTKPDGRFRSITVRVKQPGFRFGPGRVTVHPARTTSDLRPRLRVTAAGGRARSRKRSISSTPDSSGHSVPRRCRRGSGAPELVVGGRRASGVLTTRRVRAGRARHDSSSGRRRVDRRATVVLKPGQRVFVSKLDPPSGASGSLDVRVRLTSEEGGGTPMLDVVRVDLDATEPKPVMFRRGPTTGNELVPAPDPTFSRTERLRLEFPIGPGPRDGKAGSGRVLDRGGTATQVPVAVSERTDAETASDGLQPTSSWPR